MVPLASSVTPACTHLYKYLHQSHPRAKLQSRREGSNEADCCQRVHTATPPVCELSTYVQACITLYRAVPLQSWHPTCPAAAYCQHHDDLMQCDYFADLGYLRIVQVTCNKWSKGFAVTPDSKACSSLLSWKTHITTCYQGCPFVDAFDTTSPSSHDVRSRQPAREPKASSAKSKLTGVHVGVGDGEVQAPDCCLCFR